MMTERTYPPPRRRGPLEGLVVLDASTTIAAPSAAAFLADYGATVIKVEHPVTGDAGRLMSDGDGDWWNWLSREKYMVSCNLSHPEGAAVFRRLAARADVVIENFRPGRMEKWGLDYDALTADNPGLVMLRVSGFGQSGPYAPRRAYGALAEAISGAAHMTGTADGPPMLSDFALGDGTTGFVGAAAVMIALWARERDPEHRGEYIDLPLYGPLLMLMGRSVLQYQRTGVSPARTAGRMGTAPRNVRRCSDGHWVAYSIFAALGSGTSLISMLGLDGDPRFSTADGIRTNGPELDGIFGAWIEARPRAEVLERCLKEDIPIIAVNDFADILEDPHMTERGDLVEVERDGRVVRIPRAAARMRNRPADDAVLPEPGGIGSDNARILRDYVGIDDAELDRLRSVGAL